MSQLESSLKEFAKNEFDRLAAKYPDEKALLSALRETVTNGLARNSSDLAALGNFVDSIQDEGGKLDVGGYVYSELFDFQDELRKRIRAALSEESLAFPQLVMQLKPASGTQRATRATARKGERTKLGGMPDWIQGEATPICQDCARAMTFVGQIDSIGAAATALGRSLAKSDAFVFADCGMIYVFWCNGCNDTRSVLQSC